MKPQKAIINCTVLMAFAIITAVFSCKKEIPLKDQSRQYSTHRHSNLSDAEIEDLIIEFKILIDEPEGKDPVEIGEAIWLLDATLNYTYSYSNMRFTDLYKDSAEFAVQFPNPDIEASVLSNLFMQISDSLSDHYAAVSSDSKHLIDVSLFLDIDGDGNGVLKAYSFIGTLENEEIISQNYGSTDYWHWAWGLGKCGGYSGGTGLDAAKILSRYQDYTVPYPVESNAERTICINKVFALNIMPFSYQTQSNPYGDFRLFAVVSPINHQPCISPDEMTYYQSQLSYIKDDLAPASTDVFVYEVKPGISLCSGTDSWKYHFINLYYGKFVILNNPNTSPL